MGEFNTTEILSLSDLDGTEYVLIQKDGVLYRLPVQAIADRAKTIGASGSFTVSGTTYTFVDGIITDPIPP